VWFPGGDAPRCFRNPRYIVTAHCVEDVWPALLEVERHVAQGLTAAGYLAYEAAPAFDPALRTHSPGDRPLLWFGLYEDSCEAPLPTSHDAPALPWQPTLDAAAHARALDRLRELIAAGDTYQVNYTFPLRAPWQGDALNYFAALHAAQPTPLAACINTGASQILSLSPELFFTLDGDSLTTRPMKGTRLRGRYPEEDAAIARDLGLAQGPLAMGNRWGPSSILEVLFNLQTVYGDTRYRPSPWLRRRGAIGLSLLQDEN